MKPDKNSNFIFKQLAFAVSCALAGSAFGLQAQQTQESSTESVEREKGPERIVVLGSRIRTDGFDQPSPVDIIRADTAMEQGMTTLGELLRSSTVAAGSPQVTSASSTAFVESGGTGANTLSLRGLGANRTLVLLNGRRAGPAGTRGEVSSFDLNVIPLAAIDRVEILKDGASSLYGSDAVAGVVNIITKQGEGGAFDLSYSQPEQSGGEQLRFSGSFGQSFDRGAIRGTFDYKKESELAKGQRDYFRCGERYIFDPSTGARKDPIDPRTGQPACLDLLWGHVWIYDYQDDGNVPVGAKAQYDYDGDLGQYIPGFAVDPNNPDYMVTPPGWFPVAYDRASDGVANGDHPFQDLESLNPEVELITAYLQGDYELTDSVSMYGEMLLNRRKTNTNGYRQYWGYIYNEDFFGGNPLSAGWTGAQWLSPTPITDHSGSEITVDYRRFLLGLNGELGDWYWDLSYQHSESDGDYTTAIIYRDAVEDQNWLTDSCVGSQTSVRGVDCVDIPWLDPQFLAGNVSPQMRDYLFGYDTGNTKYTQQTLEGYISGDLYELPSGPLALAVGFSFQKDEIRDVPGENTLAGNVWGASTAGITAGKDETQALFAEFQIPLLSELPLVKALDLTLSARYTDVDSYGSDTTYKAGVNWDLGSGFRVRASQGTSFRSPALFELYLNNQVSFAGQRSVDPCINWATNLADGNITQQTADNCAADGLAPDFGGGAISVEVLTGGGAGLLEAETSTANTVGLVWLPESTDFSFSVDYFDIEIKDEVTKLGASTIVRRCYDSDNFATDPLCGLFERDATDQRVLQVRDSYLNVATQRNIGFDVAASYRTDTPWGLLVLNTQHTFQKVSESQLFSDSEIEDENGEFGDPKHVATFNAALTQDEWSFNWNVRYVGKVSNYESYGNGSYLDTASYRGEQVKVVLHNDGVFYHSFSAAKSFGDTGFTAMLGVANAFDQKPPRVTTLNLGELDTQGNSAFYSQYDWVGRRFFVNLTYEF